MENTKYDVVIIGGGVSGCACAWNCGNLGLKTLLIEKRSYLGGSISGGLVVPMMKTDGNNINLNFYKELIKKMYINDAQITYSDLNKGWFNPELLKIVLDDMMVSANVDILFNSDIYSIEMNNTNIDTTHNDNILNKIKIKRNILSYYGETTYNDKNDLTEKNENENKKNIKNYENLFKKISAKYFVDASGDAIISELLNLPMQKDNDLKQAETLRFVMANVNAKEFSEWLLYHDYNRSVTNVTATVNKEYYMTTAYTTEKSKSWGLKDVFEMGIENGDIEEEDAEYFQIFGIAKMPGAVAFNCPRINPNQKYEDKLIKARQQILRIANFCKLYFKGFENAYISHIADEIGVRVSNRPLAVYNFSVNDILEQKSFNNTALHTNYPIDIHSTDGEKNVFDKNKGYDFPLESLMSANVKNLFNIGKAIGADFKSQASLRIQKSCLSMGEAVAKHIKSLI